MITIKFKNIETYFRIDESNLPLQILLLKRKLGLLAMHEWEIVPEKNSEDDKNKIKKDGNTNQLDDSNSNNSPDLLVGGNVTKPRTVPKTPKPRKTKS